MGQSRISANFCVVRSVAAASNAARFPVLLWGWHWAARKPALIYTLFPSLGSNQLTAEPAKHVVIHIPIPAGERSRAVFPSS